MTAVLQATDALRRDRLMASLDDNQINYSTDWRAKYNEVADMLAETRAELDEFHHSSKELEEELIRELERTEKAQQDLKVKVAKAENDRDEWKSKFVSLQTTHNTTTTSLQRELDKLRQEHQATKIQLRDLEMGNDDLERNERAVSSSLADIEAKYSRALEEKILLEHELLDKANLEEESQRLKDELRDANVEISILKDQMIARSSSSIATMEGITERSSAPSSLFPCLSPPSEDNLLNTPPPPDLQLSDLSPSPEELSSPVTPRPVQSTLLQRAGFIPNKSGLSAAHSPSLARSSTLPSLNQLRVPSPRTRLPTSSNASAGSTNSATVVVAPAPKSKGVQMVSEMRARVKVLEQKIHTRVPRLRMGSLSGRPNGNTPVMSPVATEASSSANSSRSVLRTTGAGDRGVPQRRNADEIETKASSDTSGWVLIMEDSPSPAKDNDRDRRRVSSPSAPTAFRHIASTSTVSPTLGVNKTSPLTQSTGIRRPQSRLSTASLSTATTTSSIPTPSSRPATPTFLPVPTAGLYGHASTAGMSGLKRSTGPNTGAYAQAKRSSLGSSAAMSPTEGSFGLRERPTTMPPPQRPTPGPLSSNYLKPPDRPINDIKGLPQLPSIHANITMRPPSKLPASGTSTNMLGQSRIGRPSSGSSGRRSTGGDSEMGLPDRKKDNSEVGRQRAGSTNIGKNGL